MAEIYASHWVGKGRVQRACSRARQTAAIEGMLQLHDEEATELLLIRHAETPCSHHGTDADAPLSVEGISQADLLADRLSDFWVEAVYCSPELRARWTAQIVADALHRPVQELPGLREIEGANQAEDASIPVTTDLFRQQRRWDTLHGFESGHAFRRRVLETLEGVQKAHAARRIVVITHASVINAYLSHVMDIPRDLFFLPDHASISTVRSLEDMHAVRTLNDTAHLRGHAAFVTAGQL